MRPEHVILCGLVALTSSIATLGSAQESQPVEIYQQWEVRTTKQAVEKAKIGRFVADSISWERLWSDVQPDEDAPEVDFEKALVLVHIRDAADPNRHRFSSLVADGHVELSAISTRIGFQPSKNATITLLEIPRAGIEAVKSWDSKPREHRLEPINPEKEDREEESVDILAGGDLSEHFQTTGNWTLSEDGVVHLQPRPGETGWQRYDAYLWLKTPYKDFECEFEYKHNAGGNSGFYFNVADRKQPVTTGIEVQILDSAGTERALLAHDCGGILPGFAPKENTAKPAGEWNHLHVTSIGGKVTVTLNGKLVNQAKLDDPKLEKMPKQGAIGFQDHGLPFWLRNVRVKAVPPSDDEGWVSLFNHKDLDGWIQRNGTVTYRVENETVVGTTAEGSPNSFLCTQNDYGDFELMFEVKVDDKLNSGVQIRSASKSDFHNGRVHRPQVEIEAAPGAAGYIYSEGTGRGWVSQNRDKNKLFKNGEWNAYCVRAVGPRMQTWVNGEPVANIGSVPPVRLPTIRP